MCKCEFDKKGGCTAPIPTKCTDECIIRELKAEIKALEKNIAECEKLYCAAVKENKQIKKQNKQLQSNLDFILERYDKLQEEMDLTN